MKYENKEKVREILTSIADLEFKLLELRSDGLTVGIYTSVNTSDHNSIYKIYPYATGFPATEIHDAVEKIKNRLKSDIDSLKSVLEKL